MIERDSDDPDLRTMTPIKNNLANDQTGYSFKVQSKKLPDGIETSLIVWEDFSQNKTADQVLGERGDGGRAIQEAKEFLLGMLRKGPARASDMTTEAESTGIKRTALQQARVSLGVEIEQDPDDKRKSIWVLKSQPF
jgi:hypothetical protein